MICYVLKVFLIYYFYLKNNIKNKKNIFYKNNFTHVIVFKNSIILILKKSLEKKTDSV